MALEATSPYLDVVRPRHWCSLIRASQPSPVITGAHVDDAALLHVRAAAARSRGAVAARLADPCHFDDEENFANSSPYKSTTAPILRICDCRSIVARQGEPIGWARGHETTAKLGGSLAATLQSFWTSRTFTSFGAISRL